MVNIISNMTVVENAGNRRKFLMKTKFSDLISTNSSPSKVKNRVNKESYRKSLDNFDP